MDVFGFNIDGPLDTDYTDWMDWLLVIEALNWIGSRTDGLSDDMQAGPDTDSYCVGGNLFLVVRHGLHGLDGLV